MISSRASRTNITMTSLIAVAFVFGLLVAPLVSMYAMCAMPCCHHGKTSAMLMPMCPAPVCPEVVRDMENTSPVDATPAPAQPVVHAVPVLVAVVTAPPPPLHVASDETPVASSTSERPLYLFDSVFLI